MEGWYSAEQVAEQLGLHVRTVRGYVRDGRLRATRIGRQYRIARADLDALTGRPAAAGRQGRSSVTSVLTVEGIDDRDAERVVAFLQALPRGGRAGGAPAVHPVHDADRQRLTVAVVGDVTGSVEVLRLLDALLAEAPA